MPRSSRSTLSACVLAMATTMMAATPMGANSHEPAKHDSMPSGSMDSSKSGMKMDGMKMDGMGAMSMTGDVDYDFAANMKMHHMKALKMSESELAKGNNPEMQQMAKDIIATQKKEIAAFDQWMEKHGKPAAMTKPK